MIVIILPFRQIVTVPYGFMATSKTTLKARGLLQMLILLHTFSTNGVSSHTCHMKKYSLKMNDFFSLFVSGKHLWQPAKLKHYVNKTHSPRKADLKFKFG